MATKSEDLAMDVTVNAADEHDAQYGQMLAVRHVAKLLGVHESTVRIWADLGVLQSYRIGARQDRRIPMASVKRILKVSQQWPHFGPAKSREDAGGKR